MDEADKGRLMTMIGVWVNVSSGTTEPCVCVCVTHAY